MERLTDPLTTTDAKLWADEFMKVKARLGEQKFDHAMMLGWFANAIMVGYDEGSRRAKADVQATVEALKREVNTLNQLLRDKGLGQGEIDGMAADVDLQQALDAEREKVKRLSTCGTDHSTPWWQVRCEDLEAQLATLQAQLADRDAMILQMGEQAAVLAKENMAVKAQIRQVREDIKRVECMNEAEMPPEIWTDINGYAARTRFKGGVKYIRATLAAQDAPARRAGAVSRTIPGALSRAVSIHHELGGDDVDSRV